MARQGGDGRGVSAPSTDELADFELAGKRWPQYLLDEFRAAKPVAVWIGGSVDLVSIKTTTADGKTQKFGTGNRQCRAVKVGCSTYWSDEVTGRLNQVPYFEQRLLCRVWVKDRASASNLMQATIETLVDIGEPTPLLKDWIDIGPEFSLSELGAVFVDAATRAVVEIWSDHALVTALLKSAARRRRAEARRVGVSDRPKLVATR